MQQIVGFFHSPSMVACLLAMTASAAAADQEPVSAYVPNSLLDRPTLTDDWFGQKPAMNEAGLDLRVTWSQFYQGLAGSNGGSEEWQYGGQLDALVRFDLAKLGLWKGLSVTAQGDLNYGESVNAEGGTILPVNTVMAFPGDTGSNRTDMMALFVTQNFDNRVLVNVGKLNMIEAARATPLKGGGGIDTFWNTALAAPITGLLPPVIFGAMAVVNTSPVRFAFAAYDPQSALNNDVFDDPFGDGISFLGTATLSTNIAGRSGYFGIKGIYTTKESADLSSIFLPPSAGEVETKKGSYFVSVQAQQYLIQDPANPKIGWGVFGELGISDGNPNPLSWMGYVGLGGSSFIPGREDDRFGLAYFNYGLSENLKDGLAPVYDLRNESGVEVFYNWAATPWLRITADVQFVRPVNGAFGDDIFAGISTSVRF